MTEKDFICPVPTALPSHGKITYKAPSNIALVKYWGKHGLQLPQNPSLSFTLSKCYTETTLNFELKKTHTEDFDFEVIFEGKNTPEFYPKVSTFFKRIEKYVSFLKAYSFKIETHNSFPHSSGIASSASGMAALALCIVEMEKQINPLTEEQFQKKASFLARLGSGSASRSISGPLMLWGKEEQIPESSDLYAISPEISMAPIFKNYRDRILLVDKGQKKVSSTVGHQLMNGHPFAKGRIQQAHKNLYRLINVLKHGDIEGFIEVTESEALTLHALMLSSSPHFILMKPQTLHLIEKIQQYRKNTHNHPSFTLDAGANLHLLYPKEEEKEIEEFIADELLEFCVNRTYIADELGNGAEIHFSHFTSK